MTDLRYLKYMKMALSSRTIQPQSLPPLEPAPMCHASGCICKFKSRTVKKSNLDSNDSSWRLVDASLVTVMTDKEPTPDELLR